LSSTESLPDLIQAAGEAMRTGRPDEAARLWTRVLALQPAHKQALFHLGQHALYRKDHARARSMLEAAARAAPNEAAIPLNLSFVFRATGDQAGEMAAITRALTIDPYFYPALLARGGLLERMGKPREAASVFKDALQILPPEDQIPPPLRPQVRHAREAVEAHAAALEAFLDTRLQSVRERHPGAALGRFEACQAVFTGRRKVYTQAPNMLHFPGLPAIQFFDRADFPWLDEVEAASDTIRDEFLALVREDALDSRPYVAHPDGVPLNQWAELNHSPKWSAWFLWEHGQPIEEHCARCPQTAALVARMPLCAVPGFAPAVFFSILEPRTRIPPHTGVVNTRLIVHLPLVIPGECTFRVGNETRPWRYGEAWVFDDTIEHEAWNGADTYRAILIFDIWNPLLTAAERDLVSALLTSHRDYQHAT
jgi:aspartyl/asparaginyl beta-hydroxylase (cupin superfamily)